MAGLQWKALMCLALLTGSTFVVAEELEISMPNIQPQQNDLYLCIDKKVEDLQYITEFHPKASMSVAHHILIYGCAEPGGSNKPWNCGEMHQSSEGTYTVGPVCKDPGKIIYAWAMDAPDLKLPDDVAFRIGGDSDIKYLVMQVHYKDVSRFLPPSKMKDNSGVIMTTTTKSRAKTAGVYLIATNGQIAPRSVTYMESACTFNEPLTLHPFAFRVHTHKLGKVVSGYRVRGGKWTEIGRMSPQKPQMFYPVNKSVEIKKGDIIAARCTMQNDGVTTVEIGPTINDEMCNFYMMYYVTGDQTIKDPICFSAGPPQWKWGDFTGIHVENAPDQASTDPDTNRWLKETTRRLSDVERQLRQQNEDIQRQVSQAFGGLWNSNPYFNGDEDREANDWFDGESDDLRAGYDDPDAYGMGSEQEQAYYDRPQQWRARNKPRMPTGGYQYGPSRSSRYKSQPSFSNQRSSELQQPIRFPEMPNMADMFKINMPEMPDYKFPEIPKIPDVVIPQMPKMSDSDTSGGAAGPEFQESYKTFDDKDGGKGYTHTKSEHHFQPLNVPGGSGYVKSSSETRRIGFSKTSGSST